MKKPAAIDPRAEKVLSLLAGKPEAAEIVLGGYFALRYYVDYRQTHDVDAWWKTRAHPDAEALIREAMRRVAEGEGCELKERKFGETFVESGFLARVEGMLVPTDEARSRATGIETLGTDTFGWVRTRVGTLAATLFGAYHRLSLMGLMAMVALALVIGALTDALVERKTALLNSEITNAVFYHSAKGVLFWLLLLPVLIAISPVTIRSTALIVWGVSVPLLLWVGARNVQEM